MYLTIRLYLILLSIVVGLFLPIKLCAQSAVPPPSTAPICSFVPYVDTSGLFLNVGLTDWSIAPDFTLFDANGTPYTLSGLLAQGNPVLLVSGSFTCPAFRNSMINLIPDVQMVYGNQVTCLVIYTLEAHPALPFNSPYANGPWVIGANIAAGISYPQHLIYGDRQNMMNITVMANALTVPLVADDTCNSWLSTYGPAPNIAYLITPEGLVYGRYPFAGQEMPAILMGIAEMQRTTGLTTTGAAQTTQLLNHPSDQASLHVTSSEKYTLTVTNTTGQLVQTVSNLNPGADFQLNTLNLAPGCYVLTVNNQLQRLVYLQQ